MDGNDWTRKKIIRTSKIHHLFMIHDIVRADQKKPDGLWLYKSNRVDFIFYNGTSSMVAT